MNESLETLDESVVESASRGELVPLAAAGVWLLVRLLKSDAFPVDIPPRFRPLLALVLGQVSAVLLAVVGGMSWRGAVVSGLIATALAIAGQELGASAKPAAAKLPPPPTAVVLPLLLLVGASAGLSGCGLPAKVETALEASRDVAVFAESCAVEAQGLALERCETEACRAEVKAAFAPIADALDLLHQVWCGLAPESEGCAQ